MKLEKRTLQNIPYERVKKILKTNDKNPIFKEQFKKAIFDVINNSTDCKLLESQYNEIEKELSKWSDIFEPKFALFSNWIDKNILKIILWLCEDIKDVEELVKNKYIKEILKNAQPEKFQLLFKMLDVNNFQDFIYYFNNVRIIELLDENYDLWNLKYIKDFRSFVLANNYNFYELSEIRLNDCLFNVKSFWSKVFDQIKSLMKKNKEKPLNDVLMDLVDVEFSELTEWLPKYDDNTIRENWVRINNFQKIFLSGDDEKLIKKLWINPNKHELSIYIRYRNTVDYPEIAELIVIFLQKFIKSGYSKYFSSIRVLPEKETKFTITESIFDNITKLYPVTGEKFKAAHYYSSYLYLSHSTVINPWNTPWIISNWSKDSIWYNIKSKIELEKDYSKTWFEKNSSLNKILSEILFNIQALESELDKIWFIDIHNFSMITKKVRIKIKKILEKIIDKF